MAHDRAGPDLSLLDKEIDLSCCPHGPGRGCLDKQSPDAEVADAGQVVSAVAPPTNSYAADCFDTGGTSPGKGGSS